MSEDRGSVCPECVAGKHVNCTGEAWDLGADRLTDCACQARVCVGDRR